MDPHSWNRIEALFLEVAELAPEDRCRALDQADPDLRAEVESLLAHDVEGDTLLANPIAEESALLLDGPPMDGRRLGTYRLLRQIGRGGMGAVYLAIRDDDEFRKQVAVKVVKRGMDTADVLLRFRHERQILAGLEHPYIARLIDGGSTPDGRPFLVMELVQGQTIDRFIRDGALSLADRCRLFLKVCEAVSYAHRKLIVHRDLKPGNIFITADGSPKLLDFGLAKILDPEIDAALTATHAPARPLTPGYASPEQLRGEPLSTGTDIYSLGVVLRELLASRPPGGDLDNIVNMATRAEVDRRYASVEDFAGDIRRFLELRPVLARGDSFHYRAGKFVRRRRLPLLAAAAVFLSLAGGMLAAMIQARKAEDRLAEMVSLSNNSIAEVAALLEHVSGSVPARQALIGATLTSLERVSKDAGPNPRLRIALAKSYLRLAELQGGPDGANLNDVPGALRSCRIGTALVESVRFKGAGEMERAGVWLDLQYKAGMLLASRGENAGAENVLRKAIGIAKALPPASLANLQIARTQARLYHAMARAIVAGDPRDARQYSLLYLETLGSLARRFPAAPDLQYDLSVGHTEAGFDRLSSGDPEDAEQHYLQSLRIRQQLVREHPSDSVYRRALMLANEHYGSLQGGALIPNLGHPEIALAYFRIAQPFEEANSADAENPLAASDYAQFLLKLASLPPGPEGPAASLAILRQAAQRFGALRAARPTYILRMATTYVYMGHRLASIGRFAEANRQYQRAAEIAAPIVAAHPEDGEAQRQSWDAARGLAITFAEEGNSRAASAGAAKLMQQAIDLEVRGANTAFGGSWSAQAHLVAAQVHRALGRHAASRDSAQAAIAAAAPLSTGRVWDPNGKIVREAQLLIASSAR